MVVTVQQSFGVPQWVSGPHSPGKTRYFSAKAQSGRLVKSDLQKLHLPRFLPILPIFITLRLSNHQLLSTHITFLCNQNKMQKISLQPLPSYITTSPLSLSWMLIALCSAALKGPALGLGLPALGECFTAVGLWRFRMQTLPCQGGSAALYSFIALSIFSSAVHSFLFIKPLWTLRIGRCISHYGFTSSPVFLDKNVNYFC